MTSPIVITKGKVRSSILTITELFSPFYLEEMKNY